MTSRLSLLSVLTFIYTLLPTPVSACGGLFCNSATPVNQAAERILFAPEPGVGLQMHVQIQYQGPPEEFSWLLPVPRGTTFGLSRASLFTALDQNYQPTFQLNRITPERCGDQSTFEFASGGVPTADRDGRSGVQVTSQSQVGPYDQVTLRGDQITEIITWLEMNGYQPPMNAEASLSPYLEEYEFLAIKLSSGRESGDIQPVSLLLPTTTPAIPIRPTSVAAEPDMGVIVHLLGSARAIPTNYQLIELNYAALDWFDPANHYAQLVSHAIDEADEGRAFVTDFAGPHAFEIEMVAPLVNPNIVLAMDEVRDAEALYQLLSRMPIDPTQTDLRQLLLGALPFSRETTQRILEYATSDRPLSDIQVDELLRDEEMNYIEIDGQALAAELTVYNEGGQSLQRAFTTHTYLTRLYTTLNAEEMTTDPTFDYNSDLDDVSQVHTADLYLTCAGERDYILTSDGLAIELGDDTDRPLIERQSGSTVRGEDTIGAAQILRPMNAGQPELISDRRDELTQRYRRSSINEALGCQQTKGHPAVLLLISLCVMLSARRRMMRTT